MPDRWVDALRTLEAPLAFAARADFKNLATLRGFDETVRSAVERARADGAAKPLLDALLSEVDGFESRSIAERKKRVQRIVALLKFPAPSKGEGQSEAKLAAHPVSPLTTSLAALGARSDAVKLFAERGLATAGDLLHYLPRRYEDRRDIQPIASLQGGAHAVAMGSISKLGPVFKGRRRAYEMVIGDATGSVRAQWWRFHPGMFKRYTLGARVILSGEVRDNPRFGRSISHPDLELFDGDAEVTNESFGRIVPFYSEIVGVSQRTMRRLTQRAVETTRGAIVDPLPESLRTARALMPLGEALPAAHFPADDLDPRTLDARTSPPHRRLAYDELFLIQLGLALKKRGVKIERGIAFPITDASIARATSRLPFKFTRAQARALAQIAEDMKRPEPMSRLLQGDVGSGKTAVALCAALLAIEGGTQAALMAPTELLAEQHFRNLSRLLEGSGVRCALVTGSQKTQARADVARALRTGYVQLAIGTHALAEESTRFEKLGLVIVDEQHRFGVLQRARLIEKGVRPDSLVMTATPIPRTLALTLYGDLDVTVIDELPPGRTPIATKVFSEKSRPRCYELVRREIAAGRQAYVVLPLVEESESELLATLRNAVSEHARLSKEVFPDCEVALVHGRLAAAERDAVMERFRSGRAKILVATTVIEVGVDVPNASVMVVEHAERFGLSQLHQLRGRVGRGAAKSYCLLVAGHAQSAVGRERLSVMESTTDGFRIAEEDLRLRGMGEFLGTRQSGMPDLAVADLARDIDILSSAREDAFKLIGADPELEKPEHRLLREAVHTRWAGRLSLSRVG